MRDSALPLTPTSLYLKCSEFRESSNSSEKDFTFIKSVWSLSSSFFSPFSFFLFLFLLQACQMLHWSPERLDLLRFGKHSSIAYLGYSSHPDPPHQTFAPQTCHFSKQFPISSMIKQIKVLTFCPYLGCKHFYPHAFILLQHPSHGSLSKIFLPVKNHK